MFYVRKNIILIFLTLLVVTAVPITKKNFKIEQIPPRAKYSGWHDNNQNLKETAERLKNWKIENENNIWELSGLYQGDIMGINKSEKNGLLNETSRWPDAVVPYYIDEDDFDDEDIEKINSAFEEYHEKTCVRFRPYEKSDKNYVIIKGDSSGCWSYVGKQNEGQVVNFQNPGCLHHGIIIHEFMHALGFYHQQSASNRDEWVTVVWKNIKPGREYNFDKYDEKTISDYGVPYDYKSVMHYSATAFSKNGEKTIVPKIANVTLGQRNGFSEKDIKKVNIMYKSLCEARKEKENE